MPLNFDQVNLNSLRVEELPALMLFPYEDLGDDPASHYWRAEWYYPFNDDSPVSIQLVAFGVYKENMKGAWIDPTSWLNIGQYNDDGSVVRKWNFGDKRNHKFVITGSGSSKFKPTKDEAIKSLAIRLNRRAGRAVREMRSIAACAFAYETLFPDRQTRNMRLTREVLEGYVDERIRTRATETTREGMVSGSGPVGGT